MLMDKIFMNEKSVMNHLILLNLKLFSQLSKKDVMNIINVYTILSCILELIQMTLQSDVQKEHCFQHQSMA